MRYIEIALITLTPLPYTYYLDSKESTLGLELNLFIVQYVLLRNRL